MKIFLYDRDPSSHKIDITELKKYGLEWHEPGTTLPELVNFGAIAVHVTDDDLFGQDVIQQAITHSVPLVLYSGAQSLSFERQSILLAANPNAQIYAVMVEDLSRNLQYSLIENNADLLGWDPQDDVIEILNTFWSLGLSWESWGSPGVFGVGQPETSVSGEGIRTCVLDPDGKLSLSKLASLKSIDGCSLSEIISRIYGNAIKPDEDLSLLATTNPEEFFEGLASLRNSMLAWVENRETKI